MTNDLFATVIGIFVAILATLQAGTPPSVLNSAQVGVAASAQSSGQCQQIYQSCMRGAATLPNLPEFRGMREQKCEASWKTCVTKKCVVKVSGKIKQCPKDPDCESSCTEWATSKDGLRSCCLGGPEHNIGCRKLIDKVCNPGTPSAYTIFPGTQYSERDIIPPENLSMLGNNLHPNVDSKVMIQPFAPLTYPQGTTFDEAGMPSNSPLDNPTTYPIQEYSPDGPAQQQRQFDPSSLQNNLPSEYQPLPGESYLSPNSYTDALAFNNSAYLSSQGSGPPSGLDYTLGAANGFNPGITSFTNSSFESTFPAPQSVSLVSLTQPPSLLQQFWTRMTSFFSF